MLSIDYLMTVGDDINAALKHSIYNRSCSYEDFLISSYLQEVRRINGISDYLMDRVFGILSTEDLFLLSTEDGELIGTYNVNTESNGHVDRNLGDIIDCLLSPYVH